MPFRKVSVLPAAHVFGATLMLGLCVGCACTSPFLPSNCSAAVSKLRTEPNVQLTPLARWLGVFTTPFKRMGLSGWEDTGCVVQNAEGVLVRDAQWSTDGFWTLDVSISSFIIDGAASPAGRFIRLEVRPGTLAHEISSRTQLKEGTTILFGGPLRVDHDAPGWLEVHPDKEFTVKTTT